MPKERLTRTLLGCGLGLLLAAPGCRTPNDKVPPARPYESQAAGAAGAPGTTVGFTQDPRPASNMAYQGAGQSMQAGQLPQAAQGGVYQNNGQGADPGLSPAGATGVYPSAGGNPPMPGSRFAAQPPPGGGDTAGGAGMTAGPGYTSGMSGGAGYNGGADATAGSPATPSAGMPQQDPGPTLQEGYPGLNTTTPR